MNDLYDVLNVFNKMTNAVRTAKAVQPFEGMSFVHFSTPCYARITCFRTDCDTESFDGITLEITAESDNGIQVVIFRYEIDFKRGSKYVRFCDMVNIDAGSAIGRLYALLLWLVVDVRARIDFTNNTATICVDTPSERVVALSAFHF